MKDRINISEILNTIYYIARTRLKPSIIVSKARKHKKGINIPLRKKHRLKQVG